MCSNYQALKDRARLERYMRFRGLDLPPMPEETWPQYIAPFLRRAPHGDPGIELAAGQFGLLPHWTQDPKLGRRTYNARSETAPAKPAFRDAWTRGHRAIIPAEWIYEPNYQTGKPVRWKIRHVGDVPLGIAGLWAWWPGPESGGEGVLSFTMLTVNADDHDLMRGFHKPDDEKRMVVVLDPSDYDRWLYCPVDQMMSMMRQYPAELLEAEAAPAPPRAKKGQPTAVVADDQNLLL